VNVDPNTAELSVGLAMDATPHAARSADELDLAAELTHVMHGWLAELPDSADDDVAGHRSVVWGSSQ
jgi:hypothetical protein